MKCLLDLAVTWLFCLVQCWSSFILYSGQTKLNSPQMCCPCPFCHRLAVPGEIGRLWDGSLPVGSLVGHAPGLNTWQGGRDSQATPPSTPFHREPWGMTLWHWSALGQEGQIFLHWCGPVLDMWARSQQAERHGIHYTSFLLFLACAWGLFHVPILFILWGPAQIPPDSLTLSYSINSR